MTASFSAEYAAGRLPAGKRLLANPRAFVVVCRFDGRECGAVPGGFGMLSEVRGFRGSEAVGA